MLAAADTFIGKQSTVIRCLPKEMNTKLVEQSVAWRAPQGKRA